LQRLALPRLGQQAVVDLLEPLAEHLRRDVELVTRIEQQLNRRVDAHEAFVADLPLDRLALDVHSSPGARAAVKPVLDPVRQRYAKPAVVEQLGLQHTLEGQLTERLRQATRV